jgi:hypothetical protein
MSMFDVFKAALGQEKTLESVRKEREELLKKKPEAAELIKYLEEHPEEMAAHQKSTNRPTTYRKVVRKVRVPRKPRQPRAPRKTSTSKVIIPTSVPALIKQLEEKTFPPLPPIPKTPIKKKAPRKPKSSSLIKQLEKIPKSGSKTVRKTRTKKSKNKRPANESKNPWIRFVAEYAHKKGMTYSDALPLRKTCIEYRKKQGYSRARLPCKRPRS